ncbi:unnamed protein product [Aphanomyces euteiches]
MEQATPCKQTIEQSFLGASTRRTYASYQRQFEEFCKHEKDGIDPASATAEICTDYFHHLFSLGRKARNLDTAKTALVAYFKDHKIDPNPAQETTSKKYVVALQKFCRQNTTDEERKAHPLSIHDLSKLIDAFAPMLRFLFSASYLGCIRISEVVSLIWCDVDFSKTDDERFVTVWHKKARVEKDCKIYHLLNEAS